jgi:hypothetical protein
VSQIVDPRCQSFFDHWRALPRRPSAAVPHSADYLDAAPAALMPATFIHDVLDDVLLVRFMGTELVNRWRRDDTGKIFGAGLTSADRQIVQNIAETLVRHPCGLLHHGFLATTAGRRTMFEAVLLPLSVDPGAPGRILTYSVLLDGLEREEHGSGFDHTGRRYWLDIGGGVPAAPPPQD